MKAGSGVAVPATLTAPPRTDPTGMSARLESSKTTLDKVRELVPAPKAVNSIEAKMPSPEMPGTAPLRMSAVNSIVPAVLSIRPGINPSQTYLKF